MHITCFVACMWRVRRYSRHMTARNCISYSRRRHLLYSAPQVVFFAKLHTCIIITKSVCNDYSARESNDLIHNPRKMFANVFTALQLRRRGLPMSICRSVCLSVKRVNCDKTKQTSAHILILYERSMSLVLRNE